MQVKKTAATTENIYEAHKTAAHYSVHLLREVA